YKFNVDWNTAGVNDGTAAAPLANQAQPKIFLCPSAPGGRVGSRGRGIIDYSPPNQITRPNPFLNSAPPSDSSFLGVMGRNISRRMGQMTDGTSGTILLAEDAGRNQTWQMGKLISTGGATGAWANPGTEIIVGGFDPTTSATPGPCGVNCSNDNEIYAFHTGGASVVFADGHVQMLRAGLDVNILVPLITRAMGEVVSANSY